MSAANETGGNESSVRRRRWFAVVAAMATIVLAATIVAFRLPDGGHSLLEGVAVAGVFSVPAVLVLLSLRGRPVLLLTGTVLSGTLSVLLATAMPLLALPALAYGLAYAKQPTPRSALPRSFVVAVPVALDLGGALAIFVSTETACTTTGTLTTCRAITTVAASIAALALAAVSTFVGWLLAAPPRPRPSGEEHCHEQVS